jgi:hypothetical protein
MQAFVWDERRRYAYPRRIDDNREERGGVRTPTGAFLGETQGFPLTEVTC